MASDSLPTREDIDVFGSLDEKGACKNFLGKTLAQAEEMFRANALYYQEDLMWMGPVAFKFYLPAATRYLASDAAHDDSDGVSALLKTIRFRAGDEDFSTAHHEVNQLIDVVMLHYPKFDIDESIYGDLRATCAELRSMTVSLVATP